MDFTQLPLVSVIVPSYNEGEWIRRTVDSLLKTDYTHWELIVVDDRSTDNSTSFFEDPPYEGLANLHFLKNTTSENWGVSRARHEGTRLARGDLFVFLDGHCEVDPDWLSRITHAFQMDPSIDLAGLMVYDLNQPRQKNDLALNVFVYTNRDVSLWAPNWLRGASFDRPTPVPFVPACGLSVYRSVYQDLGGFPDWILNWGPEDRAFALMAYLKGYTAYMLPDVRIGHYYKVGEMVSPELSAFRQQHLAENCFKTAYLLYNLTDFERAKRRLERYAGRPLTADPSLAALKTRLETTWVRTYDDFIRDYDAFLPYRRVELLEEGRAARERGELESALALFQAVAQTPYGYGLALKSCLETVGLYEVARTLHARGELIKSTVAAQQAIESSSEPPPVLPLLMARLAQDSNNSNQALHWLEKAEKILTLPKEEWATLRKHYELLLPLDPESLLSEVKTLHDELTLASRESALTW